MALLEELRERINLRLDESYVGISEVVGELAPEDLVELLNQLTLIEAASVVMMLPVPRIIELLDQPTMTRRAAILERLDPKRAAQVIEGLAADESTDIVKQMGLHERRRVLSQVKSATRTELEHLLQYPDHTAGGIMTTEFVHLAPDMTVGEALKHIRSVAREKESIYACYVLDDNARLLGAVSLRDLVMGEIDQRITTVMRRKPVTVEALEDQESVAKKIAKYNLLAVPVLESDGHVVGFVTVDDVVDVLIEEQTEDVLRMAGIEPGALDKPYFDNPVWRVVRKRIGWLLLLFVAETFTGTVLRHYEGQLAAQVALSFFIPLLIGTGGNTGAQTVTTIIRSLALGEIRLKDALRVFTRELSTGTIIGVLLGIIAFGRALLWGTTMPLALTVAITVLVICAWSTTVGSLIPIVAERLGIDPAVLSAPLITTLVDATGLIIYFTIAKFILNL
ncbi:MAG: magnesium transporter [Acidobacteria bacterium]|nr:magnesium transporter [Acidobacteriota bacterium]MBI3423289.1 magnesium transporter [Acidobacteriota bacterium]